MLCECFRYENLNRVVVLLVISIWEGLRLDSLDPYMFADQLTTPVVSNLHDYSSGVHGVGWLWTVKSGRGI